jgi:hypothetical protein
MYISEMSLDFQQTTQHYAPEDITPYNKLTSLREFMVSQQRIRRQTIFVTLVTQELQLYGYINVKGAASWSI